MVKRTANNTTKQKSLNNKSTTVVLNNMTKHKYIETPEKLWELFEEYKADVKANPRNKKIRGNKDFIVADEDLERPLTIDGFEVFCYKKGMTVEHYFRNEKDSYKEYCTICHIIKKEIRQDQIEGGMVGQYNHSITQRLNGLTEKTENKNENHNIEVTAEFGGAKQD